MMPLCQAKGAGLEPATLSGLDNFDRYRSRPLGPQKTKLPDRLEARRFPPALRSHRGKLRDL